MSRIPSPSPFAPRAVAILCSLLLLKSQRQHVWGKTVFPEEGRPTSAWQYLEPVTLPVAWSPFFVLWIRSLFLGFFWWTAECTRWSRLSACYLWQLAEGWTVCTCAGESSIAPCAAREKYICPLKLVCSSQSTRKCSFSLFKIRLLMIWLKTSYAKMGTGIQPPGSDAGTSTWE